MEVYFSVFGRKRKNSMKITAYIFSFFLRYIHVITIQNRTNQTNPNSRGKKAIIKKNIILKGLLIKPEVISLNVCKKRGKCRQHNAMIKAKKERLIARRITVYNLPV